MTELLEWYWAALLSAWCVGFVGGTMHRALRQVAERATST